MTVFKKSKWFFELKTPEYEIPVFGFRVGELRLNESPSSNAKVMYLKDLQRHLVKQDIKICTFRGKEDIMVIRLLEDLGFKFVSTYNVVECSEFDFKAIFKDTSYNIDIANENEYNEILRIIELVKDYSSFSIDPRINEKTAAKRNVIRVKSHFNKNGHRIYVVRIDGIVAGFIQFVIDWPNRIAHTMNAAVNPTYQKAKIGKTLFSDSFQSIFTEGCNSITSDYSTQNIGSVRLHQLCNFKIIRQDIHFRFYL